MKKNLKFLIAVILYFLDGVFSFNRAKNKGKTRILVFHHLDCKKKFSRVIEKISKKYNLLSFQDYMNGNTSSDQINVIIAFDDGYKSWHENGLDLFKDYDLRPLLFLNSDYIGLNCQDALNYCSNNINSWGEESLTWGEVKELHNIGCTVGGHAHLHVNLLDNSIAPSVKQKMIVDDKAMIERNVGCSVSLFAYPYGLYDRSSIELLKLAKYEYGFTSDSGFLDKSQFPYEIKRTNVGMRGYFVSCAYIEGWSERVTLLSKYCRDILRA